MGSIGALILGLSGLILKEPFKGYFMYYGVRMQGFFKDPNVFGPFLIPSIAFLMGEAVETGLKELKFWIKTFLIAFLMVGVTFSYSRGAYLNLAVVLMMFLILLLKTKSRRKIGVFFVSISLCVLVVGAFLTLFDQWYFFISRLGIKPYDIEVRSPTWWAGLWTSVSKPFGIGPGQYEPTFIFASHSLYLRVMVENGWMGFAGFLIALTLLIKYLLPRVSSNERVLGVSPISLLSTMIGILINSFVIDTLHWRHFWILIGVIWAVII
ncbi:MAG: O-antigen ligase family protein [Candidatus Heimdallarchaeota archaeon]